jgi:hypothetical protein
MKFLRWLVLLALPVTAFGQTTVAVENLPAGSTPSASNLTICDQSGDTNACTLAQLAGFFTGTGAVWTGNAVGVPYGGTGATSISGPVCGNGVSAFSACSAANIGNLWSGCSSSVNIMLYTGVCTSVSGSGLGTVTSVTVTAPSIFTLSGCTITTSGTCAISFSSQSQGLALLSPASGSGAPSFRALVATDLPLVPAATGLTGVTPPANGGTGVANSKTITVTGNNVNMAMPASGNAGTLELVQNPLSTSYGAEISDDGKHLYNTTSGTITATIPANSSVAFPVGTMLTFVPGSGTILITIGGTDTLILAGPGTTTLPRTLTANGEATALKITTTSWLISGVNLSTLFVFAFFFATPRRAYGVKA